MEYRDLITDFSRRTISNLDHVQRQEAHGNSDVFAVTQLWNSLLGLIVLPRERDIARIPETPMTELWAKGWPRITTSESQNEHHSLREMVTDLRNAVAHFNVEFVAGGNREILFVRVWNRRFRSTERTWEGKLTVDDLDRLARLIANAYESAFAVAA